MRDRIRLIEGHGVEGDVHAGAKIRHRSRRKREPELPNLRQIHLIHAELHDELRDRGFELIPGAMGENITTRGIELLSLHTGTQLLLGPEAIVEVTGLRTPCSQLDGVQSGLMKATLDRDADGGLVRKAGIMGIVARGGWVAPGDRIEVRPPDPPHRALEPV